MNNKVVRAYYMLTKPGIIYGNAVAVVAGFFLASAGRVNISTLFAVLAGTSLVIACGCVLNNYIDRGIDQGMARTKKRALAQGLIPVRHAFIYATVLGMTGFLVLGFYTNALVVVLGLVALFFYVVLYGIAKRRSVHGTLVGSVAGAMPPVGGYAAAAHQIDSGAVILFLMMVCWQMAHFYAIAMYRLDDYAAADVPVLPLIKGMNTAKKYILAYIVGFIGAASLLTFLDYTGYAYLLIVSGVGLVWLHKGVRGSRARDNRLWARQMFLFSLVVMLLFSFALVADVWLSKAVYTTFMALFLHILIALMSVGYTTYVFFSPSKEKLRVGYTLAGFTLVSGTYLILSNPAHLAEACVMGLLYIGVVAFGLASARTKLAAQTVHNE